MTDPISAGHLVGGLFAEVFGSPVVIGLMGLFFFIVIGIALRFSLELFLIIFIPLIFLLTLQGYLPSGILYGLILICGLLIFFAVFKIVHR